ncbi:MAG: nuclear transport factor 2 family protein [Chloroflexi bacterium]|nr:nuclear transport factor 2 family protein [Chloroflexota bacterium]
MDQQEVAEVEKANDAFYRAFESLDVNRMAAVWGDGNAVTVIHPGWPLIRGRDGVLASWARIFEHASLMRFSITGAVSTLAGGWAWVTCTENITSVNDGRVSEGRVQATNIYVKRGGQWQCMHHHGSPLPMNG